jgi:phenylacetate-CoA ligase
LECERLGIEPPAIEAILAQGASVGPKEREACQRIFGARIVENYSSKESGQIAHPCEQGRLHINAEMCLVEIVDESGKPVAHGQAGRAIVTPFFSTAQPLIRYDQGDIIRAGGACPCGRALPTLSGIEGRHSLFFTHPDGRRATSLLPDSGRELLDCTFWQIAQVGPLEFEVRYVPNDWLRYGDEEQLVRLFREQYFGDAIVSLKRVRQIPLSPSGKFIEYTVETDREEPAQ